ncbi:MAG: cell surface protein SprA [bacterium]
MKNHLPFGLFLILCSLLFLGALLSFRPSVAAIATFSPESFIPFGQDTTRIRSVGESRRAKALQRRSTMVDTSSAAKTAASILDSIKAMPRDSSARLRHFHHMRKDNPMVPLFERKPHPLYLPDPSSIQSQHLLDTARMTYSTKRIFLGKDTRIPLDYSFKEYQELRFKQAIRKNWEALAQSYQLVEGRKKGLSDFFGSVTRIEIPIPKNPLFSIFGPPTISLRVNGSVDIRGGFKNTQSDLFVNNPLAQSRGEPAFSQDVQINVEGLVGDKLKISADWDTKRVFEFENQLKVRYTGYEDDIIQSIEAGNVNLITGSSFVQSSQALFGIKAGMKLGPLNLTAIATQKKGQTNELSLSGSSEAKQFQLRAPDYSKDHYFIDTTYIALYDSFYLYNPPKIDPLKEVLDIEVWVSRVGNEIPNERNVAAFIDEGKVVAFQNDQALRSGIIDAIPGEIEVGPFIRLQPDVDYTINKNAGYISLKTMVQYEQAIAVAYQVKAKQIGNFGSRDTSRSLKLIMKLVRPQKLGPQFKTAWRMMLKSRYALGSRGLRKEGFDLKILYEVSGKEPQDNILGVVNLIEMLGLDRFTESGGPPPDGKFDYQNGQTIDEERGELIFPMAEPFRNGIWRYFQARGFPLAQADSFIFHEVYDTTYNGASNSQRNKFLIKGSTSSSVTSVYRLPGFNIVEGSVEVIVDGEKKMVGQDYSVDYISGQVTIRNPALLVPGKNVQIRFEQNDPIQLASKRLIGVHGELNLGKNSGFFFTLENYDQQSLSDKVRLTEEPINNSIFNVRGNTKFDLDFLTQAINWLPGTKSATPSLLSFSGEAAYMLPDPNTRKSPIPNDGGAGIAYIDDFEGSKKPIPIIIHYSRWRDISVPAYMSAFDELTKTDVKEKFEYKAKLDWYTITPSDVSITFLKPKKEVAPGEEQIPVLNLHLKPKERAQYNTSMNLKEKLFAHRQKAWAGVQQLIGSTSTNLLDENINFIEFWVRLDRTQPTALLNIDLGIVSEDVIPNDKLDTEEKGFANGILAPDEDTGFDGMTDEQERALYADFIRLFPEYATDPAGDNWQRPVPLSINPNDFVNINGSEGNSQSESGRFPDSEDLNRNNTLDRINSYYEYELPLDTTNARFRKYLAGGGSNGWYLLRIPIIEYNRKIGDPSFATVDAVRLWLTGAQDELLIRITEFNLIGNQWEELKKNDSTMRVSSVSWEENPDYSIDNPVSRVKDRMRADQNVLMNEQSLSLEIRELKDGQSRQAIKRFPARPLDVFSYKMMRMFVHGDERLGYRPAFTDTSDYDLEFFFRFGTDSLNYYEYRAPVTPGWNDVKINFEQMTAVKLARDSAGGMSRRVPVPDGPVGATFQVRGEPTLTNIRLLVIGVENPYNKGMIGKTYSGDVWINELRLTDVDNTPGWAYRFESSLTLANLGSVTFNMTQRDPFFHSLEERFGSRNVDLNWAMSGSLNLERFLPESWRGTSLNVSYSHSERVQNPRYVPGTDILVDEAIRRTEESKRIGGRTEQEAKTSAEDVKQRTRSIDITESFALPNIKLNVPVDTWLITETINKLTLAYSYTKMTRRNPVTQNFEQWMWSTRVNYQLQFSEQNYIEPFEPFGDFFLTSPWKKAKVFFTPRTFNVSASLSRGQTMEKARDQSATKPIVRSFGGTRAFQFSWQFVRDGLLNLGMDYQLDIQSTLLNFELDHLNQQRSFSDILNEMFGKSRLMDFGVDQQYGQTIAFNPQPIVPSILNLDKFISLTARYSSQYSWINNLQAGELGKAAQTRPMLTLSLNFNMKNLGNEIWSQGTAKAPATPIDTTKPEASVDIGAILDKVSRYLIKIPIFDFERMDLQYGQQNQVQNSGVIGRPGFSNLFERIPFFQKSIPANGPSFLYQMGLSTDPHGEVVIKSKGKFPFVSGYTIPGLRSPGGNLVDMFAQTNTLSMKTSRPLWEGARLQLDWRLNWTFNSNKTLQSDSLGVAHEVNRVISGDMDRSFMTFPPVLFFKFLNTGIENVQKKYEGLRDDPGDLRTPAVKLTQAFEEGMEAVSFAKKLFGGLMPRPNWSLQWDGLEKLPFLSSIAQRVSLDHRYGSSYKRRWKISPNGEEVTESQVISYEFAPLVGMNITFKEFMKGNLTTDLRFGTGTSYDLIPSNQIAIANNSTEVSVSARYSRTGFEIPFFGLSLSNDLDFSFSYSFRKNEQREYRLNDVIFNAEGYPREGSSNTIIEPRIRYVMSSTVTASIFYKYSRLKPAEGGSRIPGSTTNEFGLDVNVQIQGSR